MHPVAIGPPLRENRSSGFPTRTVQSQKMARGLTFRI